MEEGFIAIKSTTLTEVSWSCFMQKIAGLVDW